jgi:ferrous iron transport protein B
MYLLGIGGAALSGIIFRHTVLRQCEPTPFIMELPPFRRPSFKTIRRQVRDRTTNFISSIWTIIVAASVIVWILLNVPYHNGQPPELQKSLFGDLSRGIAPVFAPAGFGKWEASGSLVTGLVAKEVVISTMGQVYGVNQAQAAPVHKEKHPFLNDLGQIITGFGRASLDTVKAALNLIPGVHLSIPQAAHDDTALQAALRDHFSPLQAVAFSVFVLLYTPCTATLGALRHELGTRWMWFSIVYMLVVAWSAATLTYQIGLLIGLG